MITKHIVLAGCWIGKFSQNGMIVINVEILSVDYSPEILSLCRVTYILLKNEL